MPAWFERSFEGSKEAVPAGLDGIERKVVALAREVSLDPERPLPFRVRATAVEATFHVLDKRDGLAHNPSDTSRRRCGGTLEHAPVELLGFYSTAASRHLHPRRVERARAPADRRTAGSPVISRRSGSRRGRGLRSARLEPRKEDEACG